MRTAVLALILSTQALASNSLIMTSTFAGSQPTLPNASPFTAITDLRIEGQFDNWVTQSATTGVFELDSDLRCMFWSDDTFKCQTFGQTQTVSVDVSTITAARFVFQRNTVSGFLTLELWDEETGEYQIDSVALASSAPVNRGGYKYNLGSFYEATSPNSHFGMIRWYNSTRTLGGQPPARYITSSYGNMLDFEFEQSGSANPVDSGPLGGTFSFTTGTPSYTTTEVLPPVMNLTDPPLSVRTFVGGTLDASGSFSNADSTTLSYLWQQLSAPSNDLGSWSSQTTSTPTFVPYLFGTYTLQLTLTDANSVSTSTSFKLGGVATDDNDVVIVANSGISRLLGPMVRHGANPWAWFDNRAKAVLDNAITYLDTNFTDYWNTSNAGTISVTNGSTTVTGSGTSFKALFCGGGTTQSGIVNKIYVWYPSTDYPGQFGRGVYTVSGCPDNTTLTLSANYIHTAGTTGSLHYTAVSESTQEVNWTYSSIPANYYDNVLALYAMYYRSGVDTYRDAARTLAARWWTSPNWDMGLDYDTSLLSGNYIYAGPARGQSVTGLIVWYLEDANAANIWTGVHHLWDYWAYNATTFQIAQGNVGNVRDGGYMVAGLALCALYDTNATYKNFTCPAALSSAITSVWAPLQVGAGNWAMPDGHYYNAANGSIYVTATNGSATITLTGSTWTSDIFDGTSTCGAPCPIYLWFIDSSTNVALPGNTNTGTGDPVAYTATYVDPTTATLNVNYAGTTGNKGMEYSIFAAFGTQPFMQGLTMGAFASYVHDALIAQGMTALASTVSGFVGTGMEWMRTTSYDATLGTYGGRDYLNCEPDPQANVFCEASLVYNGESIHGFSAGYLLSGTANLLTAGDELYQADWAKPGYAAPFTPSGTYLTDINDTGDGGYMITSAATSNKWVGYFFGYGFGSSWPAARVGGLAPADPQTLVVAGKISSVANATKMRVTVLQPSGTSTSTTCTVSPCSVTGFIREAGALQKVDYLSAGDAVLAPGDYVPVGVN